MPEAVIPQMTPKRPLWERTRDICGLDFKAPRGAIDNMKYSYQAIPFIRQKISGLIGMAKAEK